jgi:PAS domain-containing protein
MAVDGGVQVKPMNAAEPLPLRHTWPIYEKSLHFELGCLLNCAAIDLVKPAQAGQLGVHHVGAWECDLTDNALTWSGGVYDIFGLPRDAGISRDEAVALYCEGSRAAMERLRKYAIRHKRGFTLDAEVRPATGGSRWMRLIAVPVVQGNRAVRLQGLKMII